MDAICVHVSLDLRSLPAKPQPANRCPLPLNLRWDQFGLTSRYWSERQRRAQKLFLEEGGRTQNVNRSLEIRFRRHKTRTVRRKSDAKRVPLRGNASGIGWRDTKHKMPTVQQKYIMFGNAKCKPFNRNTQSSGSQNANRPAEMKSLGQPSRILKSSVPYHSATVTGRGLAEEDDFEVIRGAAIDADTYLG